MFAFTSGLLQRGYPSISPHREQKFTIALSSSHQQLVGWDPAGVPPPLPKLQVDPARVEAASYTLCLLGQHIGTVASHQLAAAQAKPFSAVPRCCFQDAAAAVGQERAACRGPPCSTKEAPGQGLGGKAASPL